jgi:hypothetical protein
MYRLFYFNHKRGNPIIPKIQGLKVRVHLFYSVNGINNDTFIF